MSGAIHIISKFLPAKSRSKRPATFGLAGIFLSIAAFFHAGLTVANAMDIYVPKSVVELFTSQGCSSCPAADKVLRQFNSEKEILGLAMHVDYWDRLGWKDTFGSEENTKRQWQYASALGERQVYTPQAVINGRNHVVGSRKNHILETVSEHASKGKGLKIPVRAEMAGDVVRIRIDPQSGNEKATLYAFYFEPSAEVEIKRGENAGHKLTYSNIVGKVEMIGMAGSQGMSAEFSVASLREKGYGGCALILQQSTSDGLPGAIVGATVLAGMN